jgi:hypothetical protein
MWYFVLGFVWALITLGFTYTQSKYVREYWFTVILFATLLWPMLVYFAFEKEYLGAFVREFTKWVRQKANQIYRY